MYKAIPLTEYSNLHCLQSPTPCQPASPRQLDELCPCAASSVAFRLSITRCIASSNCCFARAGPCNTPTVHPPQNRVHAIPCICYDCSSAIPNTFNPPLNWAPPIRILIWRLTMVLFLANLVWAFQCFPGLEQRRTCSSDCAGMTSRVRCCRIQENAAQLFECQAPRAPHLL